jgi:hypothetical protein
MKMGHGNGHEHWSLDGEPILLILNAENRGIGMTGMGVPGQDWLQSSKEVPRGRKLSLVSKTFFRIMI